MTRQLIEKDLEGAYECVAKIAVKIINDAHEAKPVLFFLHMHPTAPGIVAHFLAASPGLVMYLQNQGSAGKRRLITLIKAVLNPAAAFDPIGLLDQFKIAGMVPQIAVHVTEMWGVPGLPEDDPRSSLQPSERADRREALGVFVHVIDHTYGRMMPITTTEGRRRVEYQPLEPHRTDWQLVGGNCSIHQEPEIEWPSR